MKHILNSNRCLFVTMLIVCLGATMFVNGQSGSGEDTPKARKPTPPASRKNHTRSGGSSRSAVRKRNWEYRVRQEEETARIAAARAEEEREQVWYVAIVRNRTDKTIVYQHSCGGSWKESTIEPGQGWIYTRQDKPVRIKFESGATGETKEYCLKALKIVGHKPTDSEKGKVNYFDADSTGILELYAER